MKKLQEAREQRRKNNKGFSLVELIIVIAIMAVLVAILAPAFIRYVESSRQKADLSAVDDIINAAKAAAAENEDVNKEIETASGGVSIVVKTSGTSTSATKLEQELKDSNVYGSDAKLKSSKWGDVTINLQSTSSGAVNATVTSDGSKNMKDDYGKK